MPSGIIARYRDRLPLTSATPPVSLGEGSTPLVASSRIGPSLKLARLFFKVEGLNPSGSFKDRGMALAVARAIEAGATTLVCASTGNTSASAAAYAARCTLKALVVLPAGHVASGKLVQAIAHGARVVPVAGSFDQALDLVRELGAMPGLALVNSINPFRLEGQKTAAFEVIEALGRAPDRLFLPVGNAGNITAYWRGFCEWDQAAQTGLPRMHGAQARGAAPIVTGKVVRNPRTVASAIRIGNPASWKTAISARDESHGSIEAVSDADILAAQQRLAREEGLLVEPASAAGVALLSRMASAGQVDPGETIVCVLTGHGLKDPQSFSRSAPRLVPVEPTMDAVLRALKP
ncbi:MAG TPA: threonine synthase [Candidatus Limnocylindrales bacterium]|nr:threonine synthase [Candidatus Limnocylindrales bacterium]